MPAFVARTKEVAKAMSDSKTFCDKNYYDGLANPDGYTNPAYDHRRGYGLTFWNDDKLETMRELIKKYNIHTYLELGCGKGFNVQSLRMQGVSAFGIDISDYATTHCHPAMQPYIFCQDATDLSRFKDDYFDYVFSWDFLEHLKLENVEKCLRECKRVGKKWSSHGLTSFDKNYGSIAVAFPTEPQDPTHVSCYKKEVWDKLFRKIFGKDIKKIEHNKNEKGRRTQSIYLVEENI